jgi:3',5'-cyclic AMP phosphodiesterase CpdA
MHGRTDCGGFAMRVAQLTDLHVGYRLRVGNGEVDTVDQVRRAVAHVNGLEGPVDRVVLTGDLTADGRPEEYAALRRLLDDLEPAYHVLPGNHDERRALLEAFGDAPGLEAHGGFVHFVVDDLPLRLVGIDTSEPGRVSGRLCEARLAWLDERLGQAPELPTLLCMHHPPFVTGMAAFDAGGFEGADRLAALLEAHPQVRALIAGHVHRPISVAWCGRLGFVAPSASFQFGLEFRHGMPLARVLEPPGIGLISWGPQTGLAAHVAYVGAYPGAEAARRAH